MTIRKNYTQNDEPTLTITWYDADGVVVDLSGGTLPRFHMDTGPGAASAKIDAAATIVGDGSGGQTSYTFATGDLDTVGYFEAEFEVTLTGVPLTFPSGEDKIEIEVSREIA